jgi:hypothetical protein
VVLASCLAGNTVAADLPDLVLPEGVGVNIHFTRGHERDLDMIAAAGFRFVRMDFGWAGIERVKGEYDWAAYEELTHQLTKRGMRAVYILDYSNGLYEQEVVSKNPITGREHRSIASPQQPESVAAFARWAAAAAEHFAGKRIVWEIWNEPNISFWVPKPNADQYTTLALATIDAIRQADPAATVIGPATSEVPVEFLRHVFDAGLLKRFDAVSVHPYRPYHRGPETAIEDYDRLRGLIKEYEAPDRHDELPIISGEWGYSTYREKGVALETQAAFLVRQQLVNVASGVPISIWYDWKDDGPDPHEREHNFGTVTFDLQPKPSYLAVKTMTQQLSGYRIEKRLALGHDDDWALLLTCDGDHKLAVWTTGEPHGVTIGGITAARAEAVTGDGRPATVRMNEEGAEIELEALPKYVTLFTR